MSRCCYMLGILALLATFSVRAADALSSNIVVLPQDRTKPRRLNQTICVRRPNQRGISCGKVIEANQDQIRVNFDLTGRGIRIVSEEDSTKSAASPATPPPLKLPEPVKVKLRRNPVIWKKAPLKPASPSPPAPTPEVTAVVEAEPDEITVLPNEAVVNTEGNLNSLELSKLAFLSRQKDGKGEGLYAFVSGKLIGKLKRVLVDDKPISVSRSGRFRKLVTIPTIRPEHAVKVKTVDSSGAEEKGNLILTIPYWDTLQSHPEFLAQSNTAISTLSSEILSDQNETELEVVGNLPGFELLSPHSVVLGGPEDGPNAFVVYFLGAFSKPGTRYFIDGNELKLSALGRFQGFLPLDLKDMTSSWKVKAVDSQGKAEEVELRSTTPSWENLRGNPQSLFDVKTTLWLLNPEKLSPENEAMVKQTVELPGLSVAPRALLLRKKNDPTLYAAITGQFFKRSKFLIQSEKIPITKRGTFIRWLPITLTGGSAKVETRSISAKDKVETGELEISIPQWQMIQENPSLIPGEFESTPTSGPVKRSRFMLVPALGYSIVFYEQTRVGTFTQHSLLLKLWMRYQIDPSWITTFNSNLHGLTLAKNSVNSAKFLEVEGKVGRSYALADGAWRVGGLFGFHYINMLPSDPNIGFRNLLGPQITGDVGYRLNPDEAFAFGLKYSLMGPPFKLPNRKVAFTLGWNHRLTPEHDLWTTLEYLDIRGNFASGVLKSQIFHLTFGLTF